VQPEPGKMARDADDVMDAKNATIGVRRLSRAKKENKSKRKEELGWISSSYRFLRQFEPCQCLNVCLLVIRFTWYYMDKGMTF
jgi:hypothetical protein